MLELVAVVVLGTLVGGFTGMVPGIHVNNVVIIILSISAVLLSHFSVCEVTSFIISMAMVHSFVDFIPSILLGAPQEDSVLSVLPGHRMLLEGRGYEAIRLTVLGGMGASVLGIGLLPIGLVVFPYLYSLALGSLHVILVLVILYMIAIEESWTKRFYSVVVVLYSGALGVLVLNGGILESSYALFPTLTGLFGFSTLLLSLRSEPRVPEQGLETSGAWPGKGMVVGTGAGILAGLVPSMGSSQSALLVQNTFHREDDEEFLAALGGVNTSEAIYAFLALYLIGNPRSGAAIAIDKLMPGVFFPDFIFMVALVMVSLFPAVALTLALARVSVRKVQDIDYLLFSKATIVFLVLLVALLTGWKGILIAATGTAIGITTPIMGIKRSHCMGALMVPTILYFL